MSLPTFLGIGVPKAGTTWLHELLDSHPDIVMAQGRKEVHFFDQHFDRGLEWYASFFPANGRSRPAAAVGEITPHYLYDPACIERIDATLPGVKLLLSVRNPVDRLLSHHGFRQRVDGYTGSLDAFIVDYPDAVSWGRYGQHVAPWLDHFERDRFLVLVFEDAVADVVGTRTRLAQFAGVDADRFAPDAGTRAANEGFLPRRRGLYAMATKQARRLRARDADWVVNLGKRLRLDRAAAGGGGQALPRNTVDPATRERLWDLYADDVAVFEALTGTSAPGWRPRGGNGPDPD